MKTFDFVVNDPQGIHARPAGLFVKAAASYPCNITIKKGERSVDAKRIMGVMSLGAKKGDTVTISADGENEDAAVAALETFLKENL